MIENAEYLLGLFIEGMDTLQNNFGEYEFKEIVRKVIENLQERYLNERLLDDYINDLKEHYKVNIA